MRAGTSADFAIGEPVILDARRDPPASVSAAWRGAFGPCMASLRIAVAGEIHLGVEAVVRADVLEILVLVGGVDAQEITDRRPLCGPGCRPRSRRVRRAARSSAPGRVLSLAALLVVTKSASLAASGPRISISPMWLTSKRPTALRTALCSSMMPEYCTGMSQPPKSTILAPSARWTALRGVFRRTASDMKNQANRARRREATGSGAANFLERRITPAHYLIAGSW